MRVPERVRRLDALAVFAVAVTLFLSLRTQQYTAVDGALRCLEVLRREELFLHPVNHMLYPVTVAAWHGLLGMLGIGTLDPEGFLRLTQAMNAVAAAGCVVITYVLVRRAVGSRGAALTAAAALAFSKAFLLHATNAAEPMVGLLLSLVSLGVLFAWVESRRPPTLVLAGLLLGLSAASYESMGLVGPGAAILVVLATREQNSRWRRQALANVAVLASSAVAVFGLVYAAAYVTARGPEGELMRGFVAVPYSDVWGGFSLGKVREAALGLSLNVISPLPAEMGALREKMRSVLGVVWLPWSKVLSVLLPAAFAALAMVVFRRRRALSSRQVALVLALVAGFLSTAAVPLYWFPGYDKLWLQPITCLALAGGIVLGGPAFTGARWLTGAVAVAWVGTMAVANLLWAIPSHAHPSPFLAASRVVAEAVRPTDTVVRGWDPVSVMYPSLWDRAGESLDLPLRVLERGAAASSAVEAAVRASRDRRGHTYFLGVLDWDQEHWPQYVNRRTEFPYEALSAYRDSALVVARFADGNRGITLRRY